MTLAYRTVAKPAVIVNAGVIPVAPLAKKRKAIYRRKSENLREVVILEEGLRTLTEWQMDCAAHRQFRPVVERHGEIDYLLTQLLSGRGDFQSYLPRIGNARSPDCVFSNGMADERWDGFRQQLYADTGELSPDNIVREMLQNASC